jgi:hypothetical protein
MRGVVHQGQHVVRTNPVGFGDAVLAKVAAQTLAGVATHCFGAEFVVGDIFAMEFHVGVPIWALLFMDEAECCD